MSFSEDIIKRLGIDPCVMPLSFRAAVFGAYGGYFGGVKGIKYFEKDEIALFIKKGEIVIKGKNLTIKNYTAGDVIITGEIKEFFIK